MIFIIGLLLNWFPFIKYDGDGNLVSKPVENLRILGVLQRIAICYFFASVIVRYFKVRGTFIAGAVLLFGYWFLCVVANPADPFSLKGWFGTAIDKNILCESHMYKGEGVAFDPEGLMNSFAAIVQVIFGYLAGNYILQKGKTLDMLNGLFVAGCVFIVSGLA